MRFMRASFECSLADLQSLVETFKGRAGVVRSETLRALADRALADLARRTDENVDAWAEALASDLSL